MIRLLLLGCGSSASVNFIKALRLSKEKIHIVGVDRNKYYLEMSPVDQRYLIPHAEKSTKSYIDKLQSIIEKEKIDFVHAQPDPEVKILSDNRNKLSAKTFLPSKKGVDISQDKLATFECLSSHNVPVPQTKQLRDFKDLKDFMSSQNDVVWLRARKGAAGKGSLPVKKYEHGKMWIDYWMDRGMELSDFVVHEYLPGKEVSWLSIWKDGELICSQQKERVEWVQSGLSPSNVAGTTAIQKTCYYDNVNEICTNTIRAVDKVPNGIYIVDVKENKKGIPCVTEINPGRFFTTTLFFATAGYNMPFIFVKLGMGEQISKISQYNSVKKDAYWIRIPDGGPTMVVDEKWSYKEI